MLHGEGFSACYPAATDYIIRAVSIGVNFLSRKWTPSETRNVTYKKQNTNLMFRELNPRVFFFGMSSTHETRAEVCFLPRNGGDKKSGALGLSHFVRGKALGSNGS